MNRHRVFISYSHKDRAWLEALQTHLRPLEREGRVTRWDDTLIQSGSPWRQEIKSALDEARIAVLLVSKHYLESDFIADNELPQLLRAAESGGALILPVLIGPCRFSRTPGLAGYQAVNSPDQTLAEMTEAQQDRVWLRLVERIEDTLAAAGAERQDLSRSLEQAATASPSLATGLASSGHASERLPDLYLLVRQEVVDNRMVLSFQLKTADTSLGLDDRLYGRVILATDPRFFFGELFHDIETMRTATEHDRHITRVKLEAKGSFLFESLIPADLAEVLWAMQGRAESLLVQSDEGLIPWELLKLRRQAGDNVEEGPFLCEAFALGRSISGYEPASDFAFERIGWIAPNELNDQYQGDQPTAFDPERLVIVPATFLGVHDALAAGRFDVLHFSTHASHAQGGPHRWKLYLEDHEELTPQDLVGTAANLGARRPLVFLNACQTGLNAETITGVSGWAAQFIRGGCGAFIGSYWNLDDSSANLFQKTFYQHFLDGHTLGESMRRARLEVKALGNPAWLAYTLYGNPAAIARPRMPSGR